MIARTVTRVTQSLLHIFLAVVHLPRRPCEEFRRTTFVIHMFQNLLMLFDYFVQIIFQLVVFREALSRQFRLDDK